MKTINKTKKTKNKTKNKNNKKEACIEIKAGFEWGFNIVEALLEVLFLLPFKKMTNKILYGETQN